MPSRELQYRLGRNCTLIVDGTVLQSVKDAFLRVTVVTQDATGPGNRASSEIVLRRDISFEFTLLDFEEAQYLDGKVAAAGSDPIVAVTVEGGHQARVFLATVHDQSEPQGVADVVASQWTLKQWGQRSIA